MSPSPCKATRWDGHGLLCCTVFRLKTMPWLLCATSGESSHQECAGSCGGGGVPLPEWGRPKAQEEVWRDWISKCITGTFYPHPHPIMKYCNWPCQLGIWKKWDGLWGQINHSDLKCRFVLLSCLNFFHDTIDLLSLPKPNWIPLFLLLKELRVSLLVH